MTMSIDHIRENIRVLQDDVLYLEQRLDEAAPDSLEAESRERILNVKYRLLQEQRDLLDRRESGSAREAAEARWRFHEENDTLDLY